MELVHRIQWFNFVVLTATPSVALYGALKHEVTPLTTIFSVCYYLFSMIGITAGYHRLWSHRSFSASLPLRIILLLGGTSAIQGSVLWWARTHRVHHRYTDTPRDPYSIKRGFFHAHLGWAIFRSSVPVSRVDIKDLRNERILAWQHQHYYALAAMMGCVVPSIIPGVFWGDWVGGFFFAAMARLTIVHHCTFCINSLAHWLGETAYDDLQSARDHFISALLTLGEGYHNFHHQFPNDYRNAVHYTGFDPTKWFIWTCDMLGLASNLRRFPENEIMKSALIMQLKELKQNQDAILWPVDFSHLPVYTMAQVRRFGTSRIVCIMAAIIYDVSQFADDHPGGRALIRDAAGKDITSLFHGHAYKHSNAAHNLLAMMRIGVLKDPEHTLMRSIEGNGSPASPRLRIIEFGAQQEDTGMCLH